MFVTRNWLVFLLCFLRTLGPSPDTSVTKLLDTSVPDSVHMNEDNFTPVYQHSAPVFRTAPVLGGFTFANVQVINTQLHLFYYLKHMRTLPLSIPIRSRCRTHAFILLLMSGVEPNPGPRTPRYPCGVCSRAVRDIGQRALACDDCDKWCHMSCLSMNTSEFDTYANSDLPWYCPTCNSLNRSTVVYDLPVADVENQSSIGDIHHSSLNSSGILFTSHEESSSVPPPSPMTSEPDNSLSSFGSPTVASSPKPVHYNGKPLRKSKSLRFLCINFQSVRKMGKNIATLVETVCPDVILGTETWLSPDISSSEIFDKCLGYDVHRNDRPDNPYGGVLMAAKKDLELHDIQSSKDLELITGTIKISKQKKMVISSYYRPPTHSDESYLKRAYDQISKLRTASRKSVFILGGDFNVPDVSWKDNSITSSKHYPRE